MSRNTSSDDNSEWTCVHRIMSEEDDADQQQGGYSARFNIFDGVCFMRACNFRLSEFISSYSFLPDRCQNCGRRFFEEDPIPNFIESSVLLNDSDAAVESKLGFLVDRIKDLKAKEYSWRFLTTT